MRFDDDDLKGIAMIVIEEAYDIFQKCGVEDDFCVQYVGQRVIFGGTNRLIWGISDGFFPDRSYCSPRFLENYERLYSATPG